MINKKNIVLMVLVIFLLSFIPVIGAEENPENWWDDSFNKRREITISSSASLTDFPVYLDISYDSDMQSDYDDLRFIHGPCNSNQTLELDYEFVESDIDSAEVWIRIPELVSGTNSICMYYNNPEATAGENPTEVWDNNYVLVSHMNDNDASSVLDSTSYSNDGTKKGANEPIEAAGKIYHAQEFDEVDDSIVIPDHSSINLPDGDWMISFWYKQVDNIGTGYQYIYSTGKYATNGAINIWKTEGNGKKWTSISADDDGTTFSVTTNAHDADSNWHRVILQRVTADNKIYMWYDNANEGKYPDSSIGAFSNPLDLYLGCRADTNKDRFFGGKIDEVRVINTARSDDWINMDYQIVQNQNKLVNFGDEEEVGLIGYPQFSNPIADETSIELNKSFCINVIVTDANSTIDTVYAEIIHPVSGAYNVSMTNTTSNCGGGGSVYEATIQGTTLGTWNYSKVWANDTIGNSNYDDFTDMDIYVVDNISNIDFCDGSIDVTLTNHTNCNNLTIYPGKVYDTNGYNLKVSGTATIKGILYGRTGSHVFDTLEISPGGIYSATSGTTNISNLFDFNGTLINNSGTLYANVINVLSGTLEPHIVDVNNITILAGAVYKVSKNTTADYIRPNTGNLTIGPGAYLTMKDTSIAEIEDDAGLLLCQGNAGNYAHIIAENAGGEKEYKIANSGRGGNNLNWDLDYCEIRDADTIYPRGGAQEFDADNFNYTHGYAFLLRDVTANLTNLYLTNSAYSVYGIYSYSSDLNIDGLYIDSSPTLSIQMYSGIIEIKNGNLDQRRIRTTSSKPIGLFMYNITKELWNNPEYIYIYVGDNSVYSESDLDFISLDDADSIFVGDGWGLRPGTAWALEPEMGGAFILENNHSFDKIRIADGILDTETNDVEIKVNNSFIVSSDGYFNASSIQPLVVNDASDILFSGFLDLYDITVDNANLTIASQNVTFNHITADSNSYIRFHQYINYDISKITAANSIINLTIPSADWIFEGAKFTNAAIHQFTPTYEGSNETVHPSILYFPDSWNGWTYWLAITPYPGAAYENPSIIVCNDSCDTEGANWSEPIGISNPIDDCEGNTCSDPELIYNSNTDQLEIVWRNHGTEKFRHAVSSNGTTWENKTNMTGFNQSQLSPSIYFNGSSYTMWVVDTRNASYALSRFTSTNGINYTYQDSVSGEDLFIARSMWHPKVRHIPEFDEYWMLSANMPPGQRAGRIPNLWFARSKDGIDWYAYEDVALYQGADGAWDDTTIYRSDFIYDNTTNKIKVWYTGYNDTDWHLGYTESNITISEIKEDEVINKHFVWTNIQGTGIWEDGRNWGRTLVTEYPKTNVDTAIFNATNISDCYTTTNITIRRLYVDGYTGKLDILFDT